jgi:ATP-dependent metalloprotease
MPFGSPAQPVFVKVLAESGWSQATQALRSVVTSMVTVGAIFLLTMWAINEFQGNVIKSNGVMGVEYEPVMTQKLYKFDDVQGVEEAKDELVETVQFLRDPDSFTRLGGKLPRGLLLLLLSFSLD